jgi:primosomal protein N' (replication factor Y) (superfamily II helicase)
LPPIIEVAIDIPLRQTFDYIADPDTPTAAYQAGMRVPVPFGRKKRIGIITQVKTKSDFPLNKLKKADAPIDGTPIFSEEMLHLCLFASEYYQAPVGEVFFTALPKALREGKACELPQVRIWTANPIDNVEQTLKRAPKQLRLYQLIRAQANGLSQEVIAEQDFTLRDCQTLADKDLISQRVEIIEPEVNQNTNQAPVLNDEQAIAFETVTAAFNTYQCFLLEGITGSGKTEVYCRIVEAALAQGKQALVLVPEIGLTPQTVYRFRQRFSVPICYLHSGLNDTERKTAWCQAKLGQARIIIGTRSAVFAPLNDLGVIIIDEEHDGSYKQQEGFRYHARSLAIMRSFHQNIPIVLGTATPSLESFANVENGRYQLLKLNQRAGDAKPPTFDIIDCRKQRLTEGLSKNLVSVMREHLARDEQVLLFINRRGYAPVLLCPSCAWMSDCPRCSAHLTMHQQPRYMQCHHCMHQCAVPTKCPRCETPRLSALGLGTQRLETVLEKEFPDTQIVRIDRDTIRRKGELEKTLDKIKNGRRQILIGTQMLAKGHHFPNVSLVAIIDTDSGLFSSDFRAMERTGQLVTQVAGRAGRESICGKVILQTYHPDHPLLNLLIDNGYNAFAKACLNDRRAAALPPFSHMALFRSQAQNPKAANDFLQQIKDVADNLSKDGGADAVQLLGPVAAPIEKKAGFYRMQLMALSSSRKPLQQLLSKVLEQKEIFANARQARWSLDVDPMDMS